MNILCSLYYDATQRCEAFNWMKVRRKITANFITLYSYILKGIKSTYLISFCDFHLWPRRKIINNLLLIYYDVKYIGNSQRNYQTCHFNSFLKLSLRFKHCNKHVLQYMIFYFTTSIFFFLHLKLRNQQINENSKRLRINNVRKTHELINNNRNGKKSTLLISDDEITIPTRSKFKSLDNSLVYKQ